MTRTHTGLTSGFPIAFADIVMLAWTATITWLSDRLAGTWPCWAVAAFITSILIIDVGHISMLL